MNSRKLVLIAALALLVGAFFAFDLGQYLTLDFFKSQQAPSKVTGGHPALAAGIFFAIYVAVTGLSLPGAAIMTLAAGAIFGLRWARSSSPSPPPSAPPSPSSPRASCCATGCRASSASG